jgi:Membrane dipeptidase (Peptidase family M19)
MTGNDPEAMARALRYALNPVGLQLVAPGSDFDGAIHPPFDAADLFELTAALREAGFTKQQIRAKTHCACSGRIYWFESALCRSDLGTIAGVDAHVFSREVAGPATRRRFAGMQIHDDMDIFF